jgi:hypothetical protein
MALPINPQTQLVTQISESVSKAAAEAQSAFVSASSQIEKLELDKKISRLSGELGSGLSGISSGLDEATSSLRQFTSTVQSRVSGITSTLQSVAGSTSNITSDISGSLEKLGAGDLAGGLRNAAGAISKTAGMLNNILSLTRAANLPAGGELFTQIGAALKVEASDRNDWRVRINCNWPALGNSEMFKILESTGGVAWPYTPTVHIGSKANYTQIDPVHSNFPHYSYKNSQVDDISISGQFSAETQRDAAYWIAATTFFRTATKMFFGQGANVGNPPLICKLSGYGNSVFPNVPVIIKSFEVNLQPDTDYVKCDLYGTSTWVPVLSEINVTVSPIYSRNKLRQFNLQQYATGKTISNDGIGWM